MNIFKSEFRFAAALISVAAAFSVIAACGGGEDSTATPLPISTATATTGTSTPTADATPTVNPTPTESSSTPTSTATPTATPTNTPTPSPTPTPSAPDAAIFAKYNLAEELGVTANDLTLISYRPMTWPSASLDCPEPGFFYAEGEVSGWFLAIQYGGTVYEYHTDEAGDTLINCNRNNELVNGAVNIAETLGLRSATAIEIRQVNSSGDYVRVALVEVQEDIDALIDTLDGPVLLNEAAACRPVYELVFSTPSGDQSLFTICSGGFNRLVRGSQTMFGGMDATVSIEFGRAIGPLVSTYSLPPLPTAIP